MLNTSNTAIDTSITLGELLRELQTLERAKDGLALSALSVSAELHSNGDDVRIEVFASDRFASDDAYWKQFRSFYASANTAESAIADARSYIMSIPSPERRAAEVALREVGKMIDKLSSQSDHAEPLLAIFYSTFISQLRAEADRLARNILAAPQLGVDSEHDGHTHTHSNDRERTFDH